MEKETTNSKQGKWTKLLVPGFILLILIGGITIGITIARAEQSGGSPESGATSRIKTIYDSLVALSHGADAAGGWGDWGAYWNRIRSAAEWVPTGNSAVTDVKSGKTFFNTTRTVATGTYPNPTNCSTQQWYDSHASATQGNNCSLTWTTAATPVAGDDNLAGRGGQDPRTGLIWSQYLKNTAGVVGFAASAGSDWSWDGTTDADSVAVGSKTASLLCSERGNGWRLPTQKELMLAYIDGSYWNLTNPAGYFWSATEFSATNAYYTALYIGYTSSNTKTSSNYVRCVR